MALTSVGAKIGLAMAEVDGVVFFLAYGFNNFDDEALLDVDIDIDMDASDDTFESVDGTDDRAFSCCIGGKLREQLKPRAYCSEVRKRACMDEFS